MKFSPIKIYFHLICFVFLFVVMGCQHQSTFEQRIVQDEIYFQRVFFIQATDTVQKLLDLSKPYTFGCTEDSLNLVFTGEDFSLTIEKIPPFFLNRDMEIEIYKDKYLEDVFPEEWKPYEKAISDYWTVYIKHNNAEFFTALIKNGSNKEFARYSEKN